MNPWGQLLWDQLLVLVRHPDSSLELRVLLIAPLLVGAWVMAKTGQAFGIPRSGIISSLVVLLVGVGMVLATLTVVQKMIPSAAVWMRAAAAGGVGLVLVLPLMMWLQKADVISAGLTAVISAGAVVGLILLISSGFDAVAAGRQKAEKTQGHKQELEQLLEK